jgi:hypothetical protein
LIGDRQREYDVEVAYGLQIDLAFGKPDTCRCTLALGTVPVAAAVVSYPPMLAVFSGFNMAAVLQQMGRKAMVQRMWSDPLGDARRVHCLGGDTVHLPVTHLSPLAQPQQEVDREDGVAVTATLAALDPKQHPLAVDIADLELRNLG